MHVRSADGWSGGPEVPMRELQVDHKRLEEMHGE